MKELHLSGSFYDMGVDYGKTFKKDIKLFSKFIYLMVSLCRQPGSTTFSPNMKYFLHSLFSLKKDKKKFREGMVYFENTLKEYAPDMLEMIRGISEGSGLDLEDVMFLNMATDVMMTCSIWGAHGEASKNKNTLIGMNADESKEVEKYEIMIHMTPKSGKQVKGSVMVGTVLLNHGMNEDGLAWAGTLFFLEIDGLIKGNIPLVVLQRPLYECASVDEAMRLIDKLPNTNLGAVVYLGDSEQLVRYECSDDIRIKTIVENSVLGTTNLPEAEALRKKDLFKGYPDNKNLNARHRHARMQDLISQHEGDFDIDLMKKIASDHDLGGPHENMSMCQHGKFKTLVTYIADPSNRCFYINFGNPCKDAFKKYTFK
ncbi:C45 family autoproteolytic acyltransferase/hydolase [Fusibacter sp. JL216-2]|uniref:C45 family autoproteolytic acyltransferase/hydolase n=1 Tax=Fusibacter sp. JL216-2 TaxID=3071453 RepID=UPI003D33754A